MLGEHKGFFHRCQNVEDAKRLLQKRSSAELCALIHVFAGHENDDWFLGARSRGDVSCGRLAVAECSPSFEAEITKQGIAWVCTDQRRGFFRCGCATDIKSM